mmetsp:Transcript_25568/g.42866  ORF Transcript_25568/g.42866 Transcript_25568/m.42866 type:complete len:619 (-) Transcript_25568:241-2097(-)
MENVNINVPDLVQFFDKNAAPVVHNTTEKIIVEKEIHVEVPTTPKQEVRPSSSKSAKPLSSSQKSIPLSPAPTAREAAKLAKQQSTAERVRKVNILKEKWAKEREEKLLLNQQKRAEGIKRLHDQSEAARELRKKQNEAKKSFELREKQRNQELLASSLEARNQLAKDMEAQTKAKRRISVFLNNSLRNKALQKDAVLKKQQAEKQQLELSDRRVDCLFVREAKLREEISRRESMAIRGATAAEQRHMEALLTQQKSEQQKSLFDMRQKNWEDDRKVKNDEIKQRRQSVANRLDEWREHKKVEGLQLSAKKAAQQDLFFTQKLDHDDVQQYKKSLVQRDRDSLAGRLQKWREEREDPGLKAAADAIEHELQEAAREDVKAYELKLKQQRRQSLAYRLEKAREDKDYEAGQKATKKMMEDEEQRLREFDRKDVQNYRNRLQEARRQSVQYRNEMAAQERDRTAAEAMAQREIDEANHQLDVEAWQDVRAYQERERLAQRKSVSNRLAEAQRQKETDLETHRELLDNMHKDFELKRLDCLEMRQFREEEKTRSRRSIALRLASWKDGQIAEEKLKARAQLEQEEDALLREQDREDLLAAKLANEMMERKKAVTVFTGFVH